VFAAILTLRWKGDHSPDCHNCQSVTRTVTCRESEPELAAQIHLADLFVGKNVRWGTS